MAVDKNKIPPERGQVVFDDEALLKLAANPLQSMRFMLRIINDLTGKVSQLETRVRDAEVFKGTGDTPIRRIVGDEFIDVDHMQDRVTLKLDEDAIDERFAQPPNVVVDRWRHCTDPGTFPDKLLNGQYGDAAVASGFAEPVLVINSACYYLFERFVTGLPEAAEIAQMFDGCDQCETTGEPPGDDGDTPYFSGDVVVDVNCTGDGSGDLIITYANIITGTRYTRRKTGCCCEDTYDPSDPVDGLDEWTPCVSGDNIFLHKEVYDGFGMDDPVIQVDHGQCYRLEAREVAGETPTPWTNVLTMFTCADEDCTQPAPCQTPCITGIEGKRYKLQVPDGAGWKDYADGDFGEAKHLSGTCTNSSSNNVADDRWDGTFQTYRDTGTWCEHAVINAGNYQNKTMDNGNGARIDISNIYVHYRHSGLNDPCTWHVNIEFDKDDGGTFDARINWRKTTGETPDGIYTLWHNNADGTDDNVFPCWLDLPQMVRIVEMA